MDGLLASIMEIPRSCKRHGVFFKKYSSGKRRKSSRGGYNVDTRATSQYILNNFLILNIFMSHTDPMVQSESSSLSDGDSDESFILAD